VNPSKRFTNRDALGVEIIKADGTVVPFGPRRPGATAAPRATPPASSILGTWIASWDAFQGMLSSRSSWTFTEKGRKAFESYSPAQSSQAHCIPVSAPWLMVQVAAHQIERRGDRVVIETDGMGAERTIYLDGRDHPPSNQRFQQGHSVGRWEGNVLVVDTTNFADGIYAGVASSGAKHLVERFALSGGGKNLDYSFVLEDPEYLAKPAAGAYRWGYRPDLEPSGVECNRESAERFLREAR
jgi:hypothetical protein